MLLWIVTPLVEDTSIPTAYGAALLFFTVRFPIFTFKAVIRTTYEAA